jgi:hypothetical protein
MNGWLVIASHTLDDIPVQFCETEGEAARIASTLKEPEYNPLETWDISTFLFAKILEFRDGRPFGKAKIIEHVEENETHA